MRIVCANCHAPLGYDYADQAWVALDPEDTTRYGSPYPALCDEVDGDAVPHLPDAAV